MISVPAFLLFLLSHITHGGHANEKQVLIGLSVVAERVCEISKWWQHGLQRITGGALTWCTSD